MRKPLYQRFLQSYFPWLLAAFLLAGSILDTVSNSLALITPAVSYIGTVGVIIALVGTALILRRSPLVWITSDRRLIRYRSLWPWNIIVSIGVLISLWLPRLLPLTLVDRSAQEPTDLTISCEIVYDSPVDFRQYKLDHFSLGEGPTEVIWSVAEPDQLTWTNYYPYPSEYLGLVSFFVECRITNLSNKNVSIEHVRSFLEHKIIREHGREPELDTYDLSYPDSFQGTFTHSGESLPLPILLLQGEQLLLKLKVGWLIHERSYPGVRDAFYDSSTLNSLNELYERLSEGDTRLNENGSIVIDTPEWDSLVPLVEWPDPRKLGVAVKAADGTRIYTTLWVR